MSVVISLPSGTQRTKKLQYHDRPLVEGLLLRRFVRQHEHSRDLRQRRGGGLLRQVCNLTRRSRTWWAEAYILSLELKVKQLKVKKDEEDGGGDEEDLK